MSSDADTQRALSPLVHHLPGGMDSVDVCLERCEERVATSELVLCVI